MSLKRARWFVTRFPPPLLAAVLFCALLAVTAPRARAEAACDAPAAVCAARGAVYAVSSFDPLASAVLVAPDLLVTNRHVVADQTRVVVHGKNGAKHSTS